MEAPPCFGVHPVAAQWAAGVADGGSGLRGGAAANPSGAHGEGGFFFFLGCCCSFCM
jgi:hypothetical protein